MKRPRKNQIIIRRQLSQTGLELALIDKTASFVDDDEREYRPVSCWNTPFHCIISRGTYMIAVYYVYD